MITRVDVCLPLFNTRPCLPKFNHVYTCFPMFILDKQRLPLFTYVLVYP